MIVYTERYCSTAEKSDCSVNFPSFESLGIKYWTIYLWDVKFISVKKFHMPRVNFYLLQNRYLYKEYFVDSSRKIYLSQIFVATLYFATISILHFTIALSRDTIRHASSSRTTRSNLEGLKAAAFENRGLSIRAHRRVRNPAVMFQQTRQGTVAVKVE